MRSILFKPLLIATLTAVGLISALVSDGVGDAVGWICLGYVVFVAIRHSLASEKSA